MSILYMYLYFELYKYFNFTLYCILPIEHIYLVLPIEHAYLIQPANFCITVALHLLVHMW